MGKKGKRNRGMRPEVWVAIIGAFTTISVALINSQTIIDWLLSPTLTPTIASSAIPLSTDTSIPVSLQNTSTLEVTTTPTLIETFTASPSTTETPSLFIGMHVRVYADKTSGKAPLSVKLDARDSFLRDAAYKIYECKSGPCTYTWEVYSGGTKLGKTVSNSTGTFQYKFGKRGMYMITVVVCRGGGSSDCNGGGVQFDVK